MRYCESDNLVCPERLNSACRQRLAVPPRGRLAHGVAGIPNVPFGQPVFVLEPVRLTDVAVGHQHFKVVGDDFHIALQGFRGLGGEIGISPGQGLGQGLVGPVTVSLVSVGGSAGSSEPGELPRPVQSDTDLSAPRLAREAPEPPEPPAQ